MNLGLGISLTSSIVLNPPSSGGGGYVETLGDERVQGGVGGAWIGNFSSGTLAGFSNEDGAWSAASGGAQANSSLWGVLFPIAHDGLEAGYLYRVDYTIVSMTTGTVTALIYGTRGTPRTAPGSYTDYIVCTPSFAGPGGMDLESDFSDALVDNWSVKKVTSLGRSLVTNGQGGDWIGYFGSSTGFHDATGGGFAGDWQITGGQLVGALGSGGNMGVTAHDGTTSGRTYRIFANIVSTTGEGVKFGAGGGSSDWIETAGPVEVDVVATATGTGWLECNINNSGAGVEIDNWSVHEVISDTLGPDLVTNGASGAYVGGFHSDTGVHDASGGDFDGLGGWEITGGKLVGNISGGNMGVTAHAGVVAGRTYRVTANIESISGLGVRFFVGGAYAPLSGEYETPGRIECDVVAVSSGTGWFELGIVNGGIDVEIDNWSVREVL